jgi:hypothetical protein
MSGISIAGWGAVSPAGWSASDLFAAVDSKSELPISTLDRPGWTDGLRIRRVPPTTQSAAWAGHPRMRRTSPISRFATAAALEALGETATDVTEGRLRLGIVLCAMAGCVNYSRRFYQEVLEDPSTASPLVFPETVFNAPASHLAAVLGTTAINYTLVGDDTAFVHGLVTAAGWLLEDRVDGCLVIGADESDWLSADAMRLFDRKEILAEGAGAVFLQRRSVGPVLQHITSPQIYAVRSKRKAQVKTVRDQLEAFQSADVLFDSCSHEKPRLNQEPVVWNDWSKERISVRQTTGNAFAASSAWQTITAAKRIADGNAASAYITITGCNQEAIGLTLASELNFITS